MDINAILTALTVCIFGIVLVGAYTKAKKNTSRQEVKSYNTIEKVLEEVKNEMVEIVRDDYSIGLSDEEFERLYRRKARINEALKNCVYGIDYAKISVIDLIRGIIVDKVEPEQVSNLLGLSEESEPSNQVKFEILMYRFKKKYGKDALIRWIDKYDLRRERDANDAVDTIDKSYYITIEDLDYTYKKENIKLTRDEKYDVLSVLVYQMYKGFGIIDTLREMNIDGFNMGTSGSILSTNVKNRPPEYNSNNAVWLYDRGRYIHLRFMNYGSEEELRRIIQLLIRWGNPGPLTSKRGYIVSTMYDKSRILALRPPASEFWAAFIRKFTLSDVSPEALIVKEYTNNGEMVVKLIEYLMRGQVTCGITGRQGSGKTTLMSSIIRYIDPRYTIRVLELAPELYLRELYPTRNILSVQETNSVSAAELQDALKKSDAAVSIVGELATDVVALRMIQFAQVASLYTIFSHHANTAKDLVLALRNSVCNAGGFSNMETAEKQVTDVIKMDIHLNYTADGKRYIERITEIIQLEEGIPYPEYNEDKPDSINKLTAEYYRRSTDRLGFYTRDIVKYDLETDTYIACNRISDKLDSLMKSNMGKEMAENYELFMLKNWGAMDSNTPAEEVEEAIKRLEDSIRSKNAVYIDNTTVDENDGYMLIDKEGKLIEQEAEEKREWADGYEGGIHADKNSDASGGVGIGEFFDGE